VLATAGGAKLVQWVGARDRRLGYAIGAPILVVLAVLTVRQCSIYRDLHVLWTDTLAKNPACWMAAHNLGTALLGQGGHLAEAMEQLEDAVRLKPDFPDAHNNLGTALVQARQLQAGIEHFDRRCA
jgi:tetratricopeptide (TPR) repeat protein